MRHKSSSVRGALSACAALLCTTASWAQTTVTQPGDTIIPSSANTPPTEVVANAIDGTEAKYLNFDLDSDAAAPKPAGFAVTPSVGATRITGISIQSANDSPDRDPKTMIIEGSNDPSLSGFSSGNWEFIAGVTNITPWTTLYPDPDTTDNVDPSRYQTQTFHFKNFKAYKHYRWTVLETEGNSTCCMQVAEVGLLGSVLPTDVTQPGDAIIPSSANTPPTEVVANAIDNTEAKYLNFDLDTDAAGGPKPAGFVVSPSIGSTLVTGMTIKSANDSPDRDPKTLTLEGSNDDTVSGFNSGSWELITGITNITAWTTLFPDPDTTDNVDPSRYQTQTFLFDNFKPYKHYRWTVLETEGASTCCMQVAEVELLGTGAPKDVTQPGDTIIASSANTPPTEVVANAIDNTEAKYLNFDLDSDATGGPKPAGFVVTPSVGATAVTGIAIESANDSPDRDPKTMILEGSNDETISSFSSGNWSFVAGVTNITAWTTLFPDPDTTDSVDPSRYQTQTFYFPNDTAYKHYRWTVLETQGPSTCCMQVAEVDLLAVTASNPCGQTEFLQQPIDTPVVSGTAATFFAKVNGPWSVQWLKNGQPIPGAIGLTYTTDVLTTNNSDAYSIAIVGCQTSQVAHASIFSPSAVKSIGIHIAGGGANGAPTRMSTNDIAGVQLQAFWNNTPDNTGSGDLPDFSTDPATPLLDSDGNEETTITFNYTSSGTWGAGTGASSPTERLLNGTAGSAGLGSPSTLTFNGVPDGAHAVLVYVVSPPQEFQTISYKITGTNDETYYIRAMNSDEYKASPGFYRGTSHDPQNPSVADFVRFDNVHPSGGVITLTIDNMTTASGAQNNGVNAIQLVLNAPAPGAAPEVTVNPEPTVVAANGTAKLSVTATGQNLTYQWRKDGRNLANSGNISGANTPNLTISSFSESDAGIYSVIVFSGSGDVALSKNVSVNLSKFDITDARSAYFTFDETSGTSVANAVSGGKNGVVTGTATWGAGKAGNALAFDGSTYVTVTNFTKPSDGFAVSALVKVDPTTTATTSFVRDAVGTLGTSGDTAGLFDFGLVADANDGTLHLSIQLAVGPNIVVATDPAVFDLGSFHQVAFSADGAQLRLYKDGQVVAQRDYTGDLTAPAVSFLTIGGGLVADPDTGELSLDPANYFVGQIDDVAVWNRPLTGTEVSAINTAAGQGKPLSTVTETPPVDDVPPTMTVTHTGGNISISWTGSGFRLQSSATVNSGYADVAGVTGTSYTTSSATGTTFYRLIK